MQGNDDKLRRGRTSRALDEDDAASSVASGTTDWHALLSSDALPEAEAISRVEVMELARLAAEDRARRDEEAWAEEQMRLEEEEAWRREARRARELDEQQHEAAQQASRQIGAFGRDEVDDLFGSSALGEGEVAIGLADAMDGGDMNVFTELLALEGNRRCFDCDTELSAPDAGQSTPKLWWSCTHGTLLCDACARVHEMLGPETSKVCAATPPSDTSVPDSEYDVLYAGGNETFATFLEEEGMGVPRRVWLALPLEARYHTPAADLYRRRLRALVDGAASLPSDLQRVVPPPPNAPRAPALAMGTSRDVAAAALTKAAAAAAKAKEVAKAAAGARWEPPEWALQAEVQHDGTMVSFNLAMEQMRKRIDEAKARQGKG